MKLRDLIHKLINLNPEADVGVIVHNRVEDFTITTGGDNDGDGTPREKATGVHFYVDRLNHGESPNNESIKHLSTHIITCLPFGHFFVVKKVD